MNAGKMLGVGVAETLAAGRLAGTVREAVELRALELVADTPYRGEVCRRAACLMVICGLALVPALAQAVEQETNRGDGTGWAAAPSSSMLALVSEELAGGAL